MRCLYCETEVIEYPANGICQRCGGRLPPKPAGRYCPSCGNHTTGNFCANCGHSFTGLRPQPVQQVQVPVYIPAQQTRPLYSCPKCGSTQVERTIRGFSWGWGIFWGCIIPVYGLLLGFAGRKQPRMHCRSCNRKWKP